MVIIASCTECQSRHSGKPHTYDITIISTSPSVNWSLIGLSFVWGVGHLFFQTLDSRVKHGARQTAMPKSNVGEWENVWALQFCLCLATPHVHSCLWGRLRDFESHLEALLHHCWSE